MRACTCICMYKSSSHSSLNTLKLLITTVDTIWRVCIDVQLCACVVYLKLI